MQHILETLVPLCRLRVKHNSVPWNHSQETASIRQQRDWLHCQAINSGGPSVWCNYGYCCSKATAMTRSVFSYPRSLALNLKHGVWKHLNIYLLPREVNINGD